jgi:hypothetical protein
MICDFSELGDSGLCDGEVEIEFWAHARVN